MGVDSCLSEGVLEVNRGRVCGADMKNGRVGERLDCGIFCERRSDRSPTIESQRASHVHPTPKIAALKANYHLLLPRRSRTSSNQSLGTSTTDS